MGGVKITKHNEKNMKQETIKVNSRVLKFRAWDKARKKMYSGEEIIGPREEIGVLLGLPPSFRLNEFFEKLGTTLVFQQFTGLLDKNGKEIYEGDIVKVAPLYPSDVERTLVVEWDAGFILPDGNHEPFYLRKMEGAETEVIGNIYENPELLK